MNEQTNKGTKERQNEEKMNTFRGGNRIPLNDRESEGEFVGLWERRMIVY